MYVFFVKVSSTGVFSAPLNVKLKTASNNKLGRPQIRTLKNSDFVNNFISLMCQVCSHNNQHFVLKRVQKQTIIKYVNQITVREVLLQTNTTS